MMHASVASYSFRGVAPLPCRVRATRARASGAAMIEGLPGRDASLVRSALAGAFAAIGLSLPGRRLSVDGPPPTADLLAFPAAVASLALAGLLPPDEIEGYAFFGLLGPGGRLARTPGVLPAALAASAARLGFVCPAIQAAESAWAGGIEILPTPDLLALLNHFRGSQVVTPPQGGSGGVIPLSAVPDLEDVPGFETAKRGLEIAAAGGHALIVVSPSEAAGTVLSEAFPGILPDLSPDQALEAAVIRSLASLIDAAAMPRRPPVVRCGAPIMTRELQGDGSPGLLALSHRGALIAEGLHDFRTDAVEAIVEALSAGRASAFPACFHLVATARPCACFDARRPRRDPPEARCGRGCVSDLALRMPSPVVVQAWPRREPRAGSAEPSSLVAARVLAARRPPGGTLERRIDMDPDGDRLLARAVPSGNAGAARRGQVARVARTIADLRGAGSIGVGSVAEALSFSA